MVAKKEIEEVDEAAEIWNWLRGKASKIDFSDFSDRVEPHRSRPPRRERQSDHQEAWGSRKFPSKKRKGKQNVWKDVPEQGRTAGLLRDSLMMKPATTWISFPSRTWNGSSKTHTAMEASNARTVKTL